MHTVDQYKDQGQNGTCFLSGTTGFGHSVVGGAAAGGELLRHSHIHPQRWIGLQACVQHRVSFPLDIHTDKVVLVQGHLEF